MKNFILCALSTMQFVYQINLIQDSRIYKTSLSLGLNESLLLAKFVKCSRLFYKILMIEKKCYIKRHMLDIFHFYIYILHLVTMNHFTLHRLHCFYSRDSNATCFHCRQKRLMHPFLTPTQNTEGNLFLQTLNANKKKNDSYNRLNIGKRK